jgi:uridylate kinase
LLFFERRKLKYKRILLKLSGEYLGGVAGKGFDFDIVNSLCKQITRISDLGIQVCVVLGGGNFFRGAQSIPIKIDRVSADQIGMMATAMNSLMIKETLISMGYQASVMTGLEIPAIGIKFDKTEALKLLSKNTIVLFAGGTGNPFFSTDTAAVLRGLEVEADIIIKGTKVDGVYNKDPMVDTNAVKYDQLSYSEVLEKDLKVMDSAAIALSRENNLPLCVLNISDEKSLFDFIDGKEIGTKVTK